MEAEFTVTKAFLDTLLKRVEGYNHIDEDIAIHYNKLGLMVAQAKDIPALTNPHDTDFWKMVGHANSQSISLFDGILL